MKKSTISLILLLMFVWSAWGAGVYYIDQSATDDSANGTTKSTPWKRAPGMVGFAGSYSHSAGDIFIFKGGETWTSTELPLTIANSGSSGNIDTYTVDTTWYSGTSWTRPKFDGEDTDTYCIVTGDNDYLDFEYLEILNATHGIYIGNTGSTLEGTYITVNQCSIHDHGDSGILVNGHSGGYSEYNNITNNTIYDIGNWGETGDGSIRLVSYVRRMTISGNLIYGDGSSTGVDGIIFDNALGAGNIIHHNTCYGMEENCLNFKDHWISAAGESVSVIYNEDYSACAGPLIVIQQDSQDGMVYSSHLYDGDQQGIIIIDDQSADTEGDWIFYGLVIEGNGYNGIGSSGTASGPFYVLNCTITGNGGSGSTALLSAGLYTNIANWTVENTILSINGNATHKYQIYIHDVAADISSLRYNRYYHYDGGTGQNTHYFDGSARTLAYMQSQGYDTGSKEGDPLLRTDFSLSLQSPCIDAGTLLSIHVAGWQSYFGDTRLCGDAPDIGADEQCKGGMMIKPVIGMKKNLPTFSFLTDYAVYVDLELVQVDGENIIVQ